MVQRKSGGIAREQFLPIGPADGTATGPAAVPPDSGRTAGGTVAGPGLRLDLPLGLLLDLPIFGSSSGHPIGTSHCHPHPSSQHAMVSQAYHSNPHHQSMVSYSQHLMGPPAPPHQGYMGQNRQAPLDRPETPGTPSAFTPIHNPTSQHIADRSSPSPASAFGSNPATSHSQHQHGYSVHHSMSARSLIYPTTTTASGSLSPQASSGFSRSPPQKEQGEGEDVKPRSEEPSSSSSPQHMFSMPPPTPLSVIPGTPLTPATGDPGIVPQLQNIVATVNLGCRLDLKKIALGARNAEYNPKRFAAVIMRIRDPRTTALIFSSGKMVCTGAKSEADSKLAARKYARIIQKLGFQAKFLDFKIQNMVGSVDVRFAIRLEGLVLTHSQFSSYEPELFPGLIYRMVKPRIVLLIFVSGKVVLTGAKVREEIYEAFNNIYPILKSFRKTK
ncbi:unnamed protein product [Cyprideis torosa]|uniref:TATA-box-binding protein n=1 Tax=Cyprideis torosa TaxID=163714 RepID=A0A7R8W760_9CRUS|nr:unnamed protein product [Cyprideis torosa]CAG0887247.1 unnamed protein product [Cyprideis torosa]